MTENPLADLTSIAGDLNTITNRRQLTDIAANLLRVTARLGAMLAAPDERILQLEERLAILYRCANFDPTGEPGSRFAAAIASRDGNTLRIRVSKPAGMTDIPFHIAGQPSVELTPDNLVFTMEIDLL